jgi:hypothetical protein
MKSAMELQAFVTWLMVGGGIIFSFGLSFSLAKLDQVKTSGLSRPISYVGLSFVGTGAVLGTHFRIFW